MRDKVSKELSVSVLISKDVVENVNIDNQFYNHYCIKKCIALLTIISI